jgi:hypothetical protein
MRIEAKNPKHQSKLNRTVSYLIKYNALNIERDHIEDESLQDYVEDDKEWRRINKKCEDVWEQFMTALEVLPKGEQVRITKSELY